MATTKVTSGGITDATVSTADIANDAVTSDKIADDAIQSEHYGGTSIDTEHIANGAVTGPKIAGNTVGTSNIQDQAVTLAKLPHGTSSNDGKFLRANNGADPSFETVSIPAGTTINNNANNRLITGSGTANTLEGESTATYDGTKLFLSGGSGSDGHINMLELKHLNTASSTSGSTGDGPSILLNGYYSSNEWALAKIAADNAGGQFGSGYGGELSFWVHPANGTQTASVIKAADIIGDGTGANLTITDGNLKIGTGGHGIDFSAASNNSGMSSELLDDYEEGTWSPGINQGTASFGTAHYTKIGRMVNATVFVSQMSPRTSSQGIQITGLPYQANGIFVAPLGLHRVIGDQGNGYFAYVSDNTTYIDLLQFPWSQQGWKSLPHTAIQHATAAYIIITLSYQTD
tara:strand:+ start:12 stop:1223 length:1212 start_codon:yes stop_codon:yes gene_type:complete